MSSAPAPPPAPSRMSSAEGQRVGGVSESEEARDESKGAERSELCCTASELCCTA